MRKLLIATLIVVCVAALAAWSVKNNAQNMHAEILAQAQSIAAGSVHKIEAEVVGRDIHLTGTADSVEERDALIGALRAIEGSEEVSETLLILTTAKPFTIAATRKNGQTLLQGNVPSEDMRAVLLQSGAEGAEGLTLASGAPDRWENAVGKGLSALMKMDEGSVSLNDTEMRLTGLVDFPAEREAMIAALALPQGFSLKNDIETRDDGRPATYEIVYDFKRGVVAEGKLPKDLELTQIAAALGVEKTAGAAKPGLLGTATSILGALEKLNPLLNNLESLSISATGDTLRLIGVALPGHDVDALRNLVITDIREFSEVSLIASSLLTEFSPTFETCSAQTDKLLETTKIGFLSGSTNLAPDSAVGINALAIIMGRCVREVGLTGELGGHTDNRGVGNYELSAARANVVRTALIERGVPAEAMTAVGFGPSRPVADNASEDGRAANRRMTVLWSQ